MGRMDQGLESHTAGFISGFGVAGLDRSQGQTLQVLCIHFCGNDNRSVKADLRNLMFMKKREPPECGAAE